MMAATASHIGISIKRSEAIAATALAVNTPSLTELRVLSISSSVLPSPNAEPRDMLRD